MIRMYKEPWEEDLEIILGPILKQGRNRWLFMNTTMLQFLIDGYNALAYTHEYIFGFTYKGLVYMVHTDNAILPYILKVDRASRGAGYALRFCPTNAQKVQLIALGAEVVCSKDYFDAFVAKTIYNKGEIFEQMVASIYGQTWTKDNVPFTKDGDITIDGIPYQIKFEKATFTNEKTLARLSAQQDIPERWEVFWTPYMI